ncbi:response regulator [Candidatus Thioglobus sp.]|jgi:two-component system response regulator FixJ|uniref:response regulator transcription factor n=1 Tax=Candidatus Thioglobus sp. TaxID=2026721 RepID=UPI00175533E8|nr:response regulator [Candidatus Thioglobus sp.]HIF47151.1 response regulator transcription factor [Candidatus Thioglobus sp.]
MNHAQSDENQTIFVIDDDSSIKDFLVTFFEMSGFQTKGFDSAQDYLDQLDDTPGCLVSDVLMPNMDGVELLEHLNKIEHLRPTIFITGNATIPMSIQSMKLGASDFIEKPFKPELLLEKVNNAMANFQKNLDVIYKFKDLTSKEQQTFGFMIKGHTNKMLAEDLGISASTVEKHRASVMKKMQADSIVALSKMAALLRPLGEDFDFDN